MHDLEKCIGVAVAAVDQNDYRRASGGKGGTGGGRAEGGQGEGAWRTALPLKKDIVYFSRSSDLDRVYIHNQDRNWMLGLTFC